jgi:hypothetical protein
MSRIGNAALVNEVLFSCTKAKLGIILVKIMMLGLLGLVPLLPILMLLGMLVMLLQLVILGLLLSLQLLLVGIWK